MQAKCRKNAAQKQSKYSQNTVKIQSKCSPKVSKSSQNSVKIQSGFGVLIDWKVFILVSLLLYFSLCIPLHYCSTTVLLHMAHKQGRHVIKNSFWIQMYQLYFCIIIWTWFGSRSLFLWCIVPIPFTYKSPHARQPLHELAQVNQYHPTLIM